MTNEKTLTDGLKKAREIALGHVRKCLEDACDKLVDHAVQSYKSPIGAFTGNTITSYAIGLYLDGDFVYYYSNDGIKPPVRVKLKKGEKTILSPDWGGRTREFTGITDTDGGYGEDYSKRFLGAYSSKVKGMELVMCSGTEYSTYIETVMKGNVLTDTFKNASTILEKNFKPMN
ncbi:hypothetical protein [Petrimonas sulfuriphila]|uniref:hypothetical protein n=1 Tax=Petrimonas sulfuriphila TaxID=285070 RepID=UPI003EBE88A7